MKYSIRNTIILLVTLLIMAVGGWILINRTFDPDIAAAESRISTLNNEYNQLFEMAAIFPESQLNYEQAVYGRENLPTELFTSHSSSQFYDYLQQLNRGNSFTELNFSLSDSTRNNDHGIINVFVQGEGSYQNLINFLSRIENSRPLVQVRSLQLNNITDLDRLNRVTFQMQLGAFYRRGGNWSDTRSEMLVAEAPGPLPHNPFFPLIRDIPPNIEDLPDVDNSRLLALTKTHIRLLDQNGIIRRLAVGDQVYLGRLTSINPETGEATFQLNRGGIADRVIVTLQQENPPRN